MEVSTKGLFNYQRLFGVLRTLAFCIVFLIIYFWDFFNSENGIMEFIFAMGFYPKKENIAEFNFPIVNQSGGMLLLLSV